MESCANNNVECIEVSDNRPYVKCEEKGKKYILENTEKNHVISYKIDGGVISQDKTVPQGICPIVFDCGRYGKETVLLGRGFGNLSAIKQILGNI